MKKRVIKAAVLAALSLTLLLATVSNSYSQQTPSSTTSDELRLVAALERTQAEVKEGRKLIGAYKDQVKSLEKRLEKSGELNWANAKLRAELELQIAHYKAAIVELQSALKTRTEQAEYLKKELAKVNKKLRSSHTREKIFAGIAAILAAVLVLK